MKLIKPVKSSLMAFTAVGSERMIFNEALIFFETRMHAANEGNDVLRHPDPMPLFVSKEILKRVKSGIPGPDLL